MLKLLMFCFSLWLIVTLILSWPDKYEHVIFCDVGQGDATLITDGFVQLLVDTGPNAKVLECLEDYMPFFDKTIEFLVLTHMDADHIGGAVEVLNRFKVKYVLMNPSAKRTADFEALKRSLSSSANQGTRVTQPFLLQNIRISNNIDTTVISSNTPFPRVETDEKISSETLLSDFFQENEANNGEIISENDSSIALIVNISKTSIVLTGDLETEGELAVVANGLTKPSSILKAGHHGSKSSSTRVFLSNFAPEISVVSSGKNNVYNHPSPQVLDRLTEFDIDILRTDHSGSIEFVTNGLEYWRIY